MYNYFTNYLINSLSVCVAMVHEFILSVRLTNQRLHQHQLCMLPALDVHTLEYSMTSLD